MKLSRSILLPLAGLATVAMLFGCGNSTNLTDLIPLDTTPPPAPTGLAFAQDASGQVVLSWTPSAAPDVVSYEVHVYSVLPDGSQGFVPAHDLNIADNSYVLPVFFDTPSGIFRVRAADTSGNLSAFSATAEYSRLVPIRIE